MDGEDEGPNFSYAFNSSSPTPAPSWNPAFRPDHESPVKSRFDHPLSHDDEGDEDEDELPTAPLPVQEPVTSIPASILKADIPQSDDDFFDRYGRPQSVQLAPAEVADIFASSREESAPVQREGSTEEAANIDVDAWNTEQDVDDVLWPKEDEETGQEGAVEINGTRQEAIETIAENYTSEPVGEVEHVPRDMYEHQGETSFGEQVVQENDKAPLIAQETPLEGDWGASDEFEIGEQETRQAAAEDAAFGFEPETPLTEAEPQQPDASHAPFSTDERTLSTQDAHFAADTAPSILDAQPQPEAIPASSQAEPIAEPTVLPQAAKSATADEWGSSADNALSFGGETADDLLTSTAAPQEVNASPAEDLANAWAAAMGDDDFPPLGEDAAAAFGFDVDDEGFLDDTGPPLAAGVATAVATEAITNRHKRSASQSKYTPANVPQAGLPPPSRTASYRPDAPNFVDLSKPQEQAAPVQRAPAISPYASAYQQPPPQRPQVPSAESFVDKAKGGYHSPYDLPEDLAIKRRRPAAHAQSSAPAVQQIVPPPRLSSVQSMPGPPKQQSPMTPTFPGVPVPPQQAPAASPAKPPSRDGGFFADLPLTERPRRHATPSRSYTPSSQAQLAHSPSLGPPAQIRPASTSYSPQPPPPPHQHAPSDSVALPQLRPAERIPLYEDTHQPPQQQRLASMPPPAPSGRYSPTVTQASRTNYSPVPTAAPPASTASRYSPAPGAKAQPNNISSHASGVMTGPPPPRAAAQLYAPRTSSPLAQRDLSNHVTPPQTADMPPPPLKQASLNRIGSIASISGLETVSENAEPTFSPPSRPDGPRHAPPPTNSSRGSTPPPRGSQPSSAVSSPRKRGNYAPATYQPLVASSSDQQIVPPRRSQTSSPSAAMKVPHGLQMANLDRPASVAGLQSPARTTFTQSQNVRQPNRMLSTGLGGPAYHDMHNLMMPSDPHVAQDPLQRWKGAPVFCWGNGNTTLTTFPHYTPTYGSSSAHSGPMIRPTQGEIKTSVASIVCPQSEIFLRFPGPLKKGKKKEVVAWLKGSIEELEREHKQQSMNGELTTAMHTRSEERILLWKVMHLLVEHDGILEGNPDVEAKVRTILTKDTPDPVSATEDLTSSQLGAPAQPEAFDPLAIVAMRNHLYAGEREKAVWHAVDQRLWAHALLIASTLTDPSREIWKQVVQEFVRKEVRKGAGGDGTNAPLAALYQVFAGNWEESIDELVSVSARSGFQMVSTASGRGGEKDALAGLDRWRETLLLVLNNRSVGDAAALASLGNLLNGYGRVEAGHICFLFARGAAIFGGADKPESHFSLVGGHKDQQGSDFGTSLDTILLSEVYEFALMSAAQSSGTPPVPHLQAYKLYHAEVLAEAGKRTEAQQYCDAITNIVTTKANRNPYYHPGLLRWLDDFARRLSQAPADRGEKSWKPSMDKVSSSLWGKFNTFIAGEDSSENAVPGPVPDAATSGEMPAFTPMAMPTFPAAPQRTVSSSDIGYGGAYAPNGAVHTPPVASTGAGGRYAPGSSYTPRSSSEQVRPKHSSHSQSAHEPRSSNEFSPPSSYTPSALGQQQSYAPEGLGLHQGASASPYMPSSAQGMGTGRSPSYLPTPPLEQAASTNGYSPAPIEDIPQDSYQPETTQTYGYEPPTSSYEPPSYQPYEPDESAAEQESDEQQKPKKKSFMDDDEDEDDLAKRAEALKKQQRAEADRQADEAFRKAAEADAAKGKQSPANGQRGSWFGGWFGGKKSEDLNAANANGPKVYKAKLGEESSFVFDKDLGRWVNKKAGAEASAPVAATPPPPKMNGPPSRPASGMHAPPPTSSSSSAPPPLAGTPPAKSASPASMAPPSSSGSMGPPQRSASAMPGPVAALAGGSGPPSRPPSRPSTSMSNASDIDDLLGPAMGGTRKAGAKKGARKGRYVDVMAQK